MIYKIKMMSGQEVVLESEEALESFLREANSGKKLILTKYGIVNVASIDSIVKHKEKMQEISEAIGYGKTPEQARAEIMGDSPFSKLLAKKMEMLPPEKRTAAQEDGSRRAK